MKRKKKKEREKKTHKTEKNVYIKKITTSKSK